MFTWPLALVVSTVLAAIGFVMVAVFWLRKLRDTLGAALGETAVQQIRSAKHLGDLLAHIERRQQLLERQVKAMAEAQLRMRQEMASLQAIKAQKREEGDAPASPADPTRILH